MRVIGWAGVGLVGAISIVGCRTATRVAVVPRVDLSLEGGNRGYLMGTPPPPSEQRTTREMVQTDVEVPSWYQPKRSDRSKRMLKEIAPPEVDMAEQAGTGTQLAQGTYDTYTVKSNESLWSIAAKKEIYGKATRWRRIYDANRDILKSPDKVHAGMVLKIPRDQGKGKTMPDEGTTFKK